jgi:hypothetical protein
LPYRFGLTAVVHLAVPPSFFDKQLGFFPPRKAYEHLLTRLSHDGDIENIVKIVKSMTTTKTIGHVAPDHSTFFIALRACKLNNKVDEFAELVSMTTASGVHLPPGVVNLINDAPLTPVVEADPVDEVAEPEDGKS